MARLLIVDDSKDLQDFFTVLLTYRNHEDQTAGSRESMYTAIANFKPQLVLLDVKLANDCGRALCKELKENPATAHIPVILISANPELLTDFEECRADDVLEKPFGIDVLFQKIDVYTSQ